MRLTGIIEGLRQFEWDDALVDGLNRARVGVINLSRLLEGGKLADNWGGAMLEEVSAMTGAGKSSDVAFFLADQDRLYQTYAFGFVHDPLNAPPPDPAVLTEVMQIVSGDIESDNQSAGRSPANSSKATGAFSTTRSLHSSTIFPSRSVPNTRTEWWTAGRHG